MGRGRLTLAAAAAALCATLATGGCSGDRDTGEGRKIEAAVKRFAHSHGPDACNLMTHRALSRVYGGRSASAVVGKARCRARSSRFEGERVAVTFVKIKTSTEAQATAKTLDGRRYWTVGLLKRRGRWLIDAVTTAQRPS
jgi:hypothetical protein